MKKATYFCMFVLLTLLFGCASSPKVNKMNYLLGDIGPGGGIVFYDKGNTLNNWRYLEVDFEMKNCWVWGVEGMKIQANGTEIGDGKKNSGIIAKKIKGSYTAADMCISTKCGNCLKNGWYLPSREELKQIVNFINQTSKQTKYESYWSSTEFSADEAYCMESSGEIGTSKKEKAHGIFPIRAF